MIIDIHAHVFAFPKRHYGNPPNTFMSMEEQIALMDAKGIDQAVILPLANPETPAELQSWGEVLYICERYPGRFIPFCNIDPRLPRRPDLITIDDFLEILNQCKALGFKGIGEVTARIPWDDPSLDKLFAACEQVGFPLTFHTITPDVNSYGLIDDLGFPRFEKVLQKFPRLNFLGHSLSFWSEISGGITVSDKNSYPPGPVRPGGRLPELLRRYPNLNGDLSAGSGLNALSRDPEHAFRFIEEFQDRLFLGLDYCCVQNNMRHIEWFKEHRDAGRITRQAYEKIMWQNANRLLQLNLKG
jgi:predicted TIM-barrel fold metal-dependent hydrolase